jgi:hypothetical protein
MKHNCTLDHDVLEKLAVLKVGWFTDNARAEKSAKLPDLPETEKTAPKIPQKPKQLSML